MIIRPKLIERVRPGTQGPWAITHINVTEDAARWAKLRAMIGGGDPYAYTTPGPYVSLTWNKSIIMSDTDMEWRTCASLVTRKALERYTSGSHVRVLLTGLGLAFAPWTIRVNTLRATITVIEHDLDVITLMKPNLPRGVNIIHDDALTWNAPRGSRWDVIFHDIWPTICDDNLDTMRELHRRFKHRLTVGGWQGSWRYNECLRMARRGGSWR